ncbi:hypothetical protein HY384_03445 [Candidatus Daviesbacteria bacterium]|nr:hypothetical protein [Candidatus Daviesbacteria bacterium]
MRYEVLEGIFPYEPHEIDNVVGRIRLLRSEHVDKAPIVLLSWQMRKMGKESVRKIEKGIFPQVTPEGVERSNPMFKRFSDLTLPAVILVAVGSAIEGLDQAMWDGFFSVKNYFDEIGYGVSGTVYGPLFNQSGGFTNDRSNEPVDINGMLDILKQDKTFAEVLRREVLLPLTLRRQFFQSGTEIRDCFFRILNSYQPVAARVILELTPSKVG